MVVYERIEGTDLIRAYSDTGHKLVSEDGDVYDEAIDPDYTNRKYTESDELLEETEDEPEEESEE